MAAKNVVADITRGDKLSGNNYDIWHKKFSIFSMSKSFWKPYSVK